MSDQDSTRSIEVTRTGPRRYRADNVRGGTISVGEGTTDDFTPVELLLVAVAGCSAIDVDYLASRRAEPDSFTVHAETEKFHDADGNHLGRVVVTFQITFPEGAAGDQAREILPTAVAMSRDRLCTVSRTIALPTPVTFIVSE